MIHAADLDTDLPSKGDEIEIFKRLATAIESGVQDIDHDLRRQAKLLPLSAFIWLFTTVRLEKIRKVAYADKERKNLRIFSRLCEDFTLIALVNLGLENIKVICCQLEKGKPTNGGALYDQKSCGAPKSAVGAPAE